MQEKTVIITGANSGLGFACARAIAASGQNWTIVMACRNAKKGEAAKRRIAAETGHTNITVLELDLASLASVRGFVDRFDQAALPPLRGLVNNAGMQVLQGLERTADGFEVTFGTNHLGHFLLTNLLLDRLAAPARIVVVSSGTHDPTTLDGRFNKPVFLGARRLAFPESANEMSGLQRYATSKLSNLLFAYELDRRLKASDRRGITVNAYDPAAVPATNLLGSIKNPLVRGLLRGLTQAFRVFGVTISTPTRSGAAMARLLLDPQLKGVSGKYFQIERERPSSADSYDPELARQLWEDSLDLVVPEPTRPNGAAPRSGAGFVS